MALWELHRLKRPLVAVLVCGIKGGTPYLPSQTVYNTKGTRAHTHRELIRQWLWEPKGSSLEYI